ncbi:integrase-like protein [Rhodococcus sp. SMB37]|nr:integrase-like protein [Rhodococcus sp. SMB37]
MHFTSTSCSWLNMVEIFFGIITRQAIRRGTFASVTDLESTITDYIDSYNDRAKPFAWTKTASHLIDKIKRKSINNTKHLESLSVIGSSGFTTAVGVIRASR